MSKSISQIIDAVSESVGSHDWGYVAKVEVVNAVLAHGELDLAAARQEALALEGRCENLRVDGERLIDKVLARDTEIERLTSDLEDARKGLTPFPDEFAERMTKLSEPTAATNENTARPLGSPHAPIPAGTSQDSPGAAAPPIAALKQLAAQNPPPQEWFDDDASDVAAIEIAKASGSATSYDELRKELGLPENSGDATPPVPWPAIESAELRRQWQASGKGAQCSACGYYTIGARPNTNVAACEVCKVRAQNNELRKSYERVMATEDERRQELAHLRERLAACEVQVNNLEGSRDYALRKLREAMPSIPLVENRGLENLVGHAITRLSARERDGQLLEWMEQEVITIHTPVKIGGDWTAVRDRATYASGPTLLEALLALRDKLEAK